MFLLQLNGLKYAGFQVAYAAWGKQFVLY